MWTFGWWRMLESGKAVACWAWLKPNDSSLTSKNNPTLLDHRRLPCQLLSPSRLSLASANEALHFLCQEGESVAMSLGRETRQSDAPEFSVWPSHYCLACKHDGTLSLRCFQILFDLINLPPSRYFLPLTSLSSSGSMS
jgi:hypothetical protein